MPRPAARSFAPVIYPSLVAISSLALALVQSQSLPEKRVFDMRPCWPFAVRRRRREGLPLAALGLPDSAYSRPRRRALFSRSCRHDHGSSSWRHHTRPSLFLWPCAPTSARSPSRRQRAKPMTLRRRTDGAQWVRRRIVISFLFHPAAPLELRRAQHPSVVRRTESTAGRRVCAAMLRCWGGGGRRDKRLPQ